MNYDHQAIKTAADLFKKNTENDNRLMIVMSDGQPNGSNYGGEEAQELTKKTALDVEKRGIEILHIAIEDFDNRCMFKNSLQFTDIPELMNDMRRLITKIIKRATEE
jgi:nitric oxide reductase activation protein